MVRIVGEVVMLKSCFFPDMFRSQSTSGTLCHVFTQLGLAQVCVSWFKGYFSKEHSGACNCSCLFNPSQQALYMSLMGTFALHEAVIYLQTNILKDSSILKGQGSAFFTGAMPRTTPDAVLVA